MAALIVNLTLAVGLDAQGWPSAAQQFQGTLITTGNNRSRLYNLWAYDSGLAYLGLTPIGVDVPALRSGRRRFAYGCMDWSERRPHLAGALGAAVAERCIALGWLARQKHSRALVVTEAGQGALQTWLSRV